ncbi:MAG: glycerophosphodiester phosphodiesterase [Clostridia bacterium]|nr:glycerophosphodiester phosphodiesterase [Clostridia bacterium]
MAKIWAHRGASAYAPENTIEAFKLAAEMGADGVELDVHMSKDGKLVVIHDEKIDRTSNGTGYVKDMTVKELKSYDFSAGKTGFKNIRIPTLREALNFLKPLNIDVNIEIKADKVIYEGICEDVIKTVDLVGVGDKVIYSSFNHYILMKMREINPAVRIGLLYAGALFEPWVYAKQLKANAIHPNFAIPINIKNTVAASHANGIAVHAWTADDPEIVAKLAAIEVDAIVTNRPDVAVRVNKGEIIYKN